MAKQQTMRALEAQDFSIDALKLVDRPIPKPRRGEILLRVRAVTLNYRDLAILVEKYLPTLALPYVPASDASGEVVEVGEDVTRFKVGDRVMPIYTQGWHDGKPTPEQRTKRTLGAPSPVCCRSTLSYPLRTPSRRHPISMTSKLPPCPSQP